MRVNIESYSNEIKEYKEPVKSLLIELKECYLETNKDNKTPQYIYKLALQIIHELFNPNNVYIEPMIPLSFFKTIVGKVLLTILQEENSRNVTIQDIVTMSKSPQKPNGLSSQYISKQIKDGKLRAERYHGRWLINIDDAKSFLNNRKPNTSH